jgi:hypothetical protein
MYRFPSTPSQRDSLHIRELPAQICRIRDRIRCKDGRLLSRKKCKLQRATRHVSHHPLSIVRTAQTVSVQKFLCPGHIQSIQTAVSPRCAVCVEKCACLSLLESAYSSDGKAQEVDGDLFIRKGNIPRYRPRGRATRAPISLVPCHRCHATNQHQPHNRAS